MENNPPTKVLKLKKIMLKKATRKSKEFHKDARWLMGHGPSVVSTDAGSILGKKIRQPKNLFFLCVKSMFKAL